jgi:hypothetical protein
MPLSPLKIEAVASAIGDNLTQPEIEQAVLDATGKALYREFAGPTDPLSLAVRRTLNTLNGDGRERWLLTYVLVAAVANDGLRRLIFDAYPQALTSLPNVEEQVDGVLRRLRDVMDAVLKPDIKPRLKPARGAFAAISRKITTLLAYKGLHAHLHGLQLKFTVRPALGPAADQLARLEELKDWHKQVTEVSVKARATGAPLANDPDVPSSELEWITRLERLVAQWQLALAAADVSSASAFLTAVQSLVPRQLSDLNTKIFETARNLSLSDLFFSLPLDVRAPFIEFAFAVQNLKPTVLARVFEHKIWQDVDDGISQIELLFDAPAGAKKFKNQWVDLRTLVFWLATLYPDAAWPNEAKKHSEEIDDELVKKSFEEIGDEIAVDAASPQIKPSFENYRRLIRFQFLEMDKHLKDDCSSLLKFGEPLQSFIKGIGDG